MSKLRYFTYDEFDSPDVPMSGKMFMDRDFVHLLDNARNYAGIPFRINSGYRSKNHNIRVGGTPNSSHLKGLAADIHAPTVGDKFKIVKSLIRVGINRIFIYDTFIHCDIDLSKVNPALRGY